VINSLLKKARLFVAVSHFRPSRIFAGKAWSRVEPIVWLACCKY